MEPKTLNEPTPPTIAVGGGFSGALVATHLLKTAPQPLTIKLIERREQKQTTDGVTVTIRPRQNKSKNPINQIGNIWQVNRVVNCTGVATDYRRSPNPLVDSLRSQDLIRPNAIGLGLDTAANGALLDGTGQASNLLYTIGTPRKGDLWETIAVPEVHGQAQALAETLWRSQPLRVRSIPTTHELIGDILSQATPQ